MSNISEIILKLMTFFIIYSFLGWVLESVYKSIIQKKFVNSGFLHGPLCPIYGIGAIIMYIFLNFLSDNIIILFIAGIVVLSIWEYLVGWYLEKMFNTKYWDYSENKFNLHGRICLVNSLLWGVLGVVFIKFINPIIETQLYNIPTNLIIYINCIIYVYIIVDIIYSVIKVKHININLKKLEELKTTIKLKIEELKSIGDNITHKPINKESLLNIIEELKEQQNILKHKVSKQVNRLRKAFPTMKSEGLTEFLSNKLEKTRDILNRAKHKEK